LCYKKVNKQVEATIWIKEQKKVGKQRQWHSQGGEGHLPPHYKVIVKKNCQQLASN